MEQRERAYYSFRNESLAHRGFIGPFKTADTERVAATIREVFGHHVAVFDAGGLLAEKAASSDPPGARELAAQFYQDYYLEPQLFRDQDDDIEISRFIEEVPLARVDGKRNNLFFLLGDVGTGKTAFINYLITRRGAEWVKKRKIWFIRLDVDLHGNGQLLTVDALVQGIANKIVRVFGRDGNLLELPVNLNVQLAGLQDGTTGVQLQSRLCQFVRNYAEIRGRTLFLMIDNLDYLYHVNDRTVFSNTHSPADKAAMQCVADIVAAFRHDGAQGFLADMGANVLFSLRRDSYSILQESSVLFNPSLVFQNNLRVYSLGPTPWRRVVEQRGGLLEYAISRNPRGRHRVQQAIIQPILQDLEWAPEHGGRGLMDHLLKITNFGLRDVIDFLATYSWLGEGGDQALGYQRLMRSYPVGLLIYILGRSRRFSQATSRFPNVYLVNEQEELAVSADPSTRAVRAPHTYWLNRLILHYVEYHQKNDERVRLSDIVGCFCSTPAGYPEALVRAALGNMAQANVTNVLRVNKTHAGNNQFLSVSDILLTERGGHCLSDVFDRFFYLQLIVEDHLLPIPKVLAPYFKFADPGVDYSYLCGSPTDYRDKFGEMIRLKAKQVFLFLDVLATSLECEKVRFSSAFQELESLGIALPDLAPIRKNIYGELRQLMERHSGTLNVEDIDHQARELRGEIEQALRAAYLQASAKA
jgi:hypothetical protein